MGLNFSAYAFIYTESLSSQLFKARLEMVAKLDSRIDAGLKATEPEGAYGDQHSDAQLRGELAGLLHQQVAAMNLDNFVVRPQRKPVDKFAKLEA
jgi:type I restriction enzyme R subunit